MDNWFEAMFVLGVLALGTALVVALIWRGSAVLCARSARIRAEEYRELALRAVAAQEQTAAELASVRSRVDGIDEILRQVD